MDSDFDSDGFLNYAYDNEKLEDVILKLCEYSENIF